MSIVGLSLSAMFTACSSGHDVEDTTNVVYNEEGKAGVTSDQFRGIDHIRLIPFSGVPGSASTKLADIISLSSINALEKPGSVNYKVYADQFVPVGTKNFLFYGKAVDRYVDEPVTSMNDKFKYGVLKYNGLTESEFSTCQ